MTTVNGLRVEVRRQHRSGSDAARLVIASGELDLTNCPALVERLRAVEGSDGPPIVLDLRPLEFIDSTGLQAILEASRRAGTNGHRFAVVSNPGQVRRMLALTGLDTRIIVADTIQDALAVGRPSASGD